MKKLIALAVLGGLIWAIKMLPWWGGVAVVAGVSLLCVTLLKRFAMSFFVGAFKAKSAVLKGASARVLAITPAQPPKPDFDDCGDEDGAELEFDEPRNWVYVDVEIDVPGNTETPMRQWDPCELSLVKEDARAESLLEGGDGEDEEIGMVAGVEVWENGAWRVLEDEVSGSQRLRLHVAARPNIDRFKIRYYFELLANTS